MSEQAYLKSTFRPCEIEHAYGANVRLLDDPLAWTRLARLCSQLSTQPEVGRLVRWLYERLSDVVLSAELPRERVDIPTRMAAHLPAEGVYRGLAIARSTKAVTVGIARAGTQPSQVVYELMNEVLDPALVRQDHLFMSRETDASGKVTGVSWHDAKIGRDVDGRFVLFPDPMGASGSSMVGAIGHYKTKLEGKPARIIAMHLIVTPEYLRAMRDAHPDVVVYALRLDRGLSPTHVLAAKPGELWAEERGLDERSYIVPGAGGVGEILNNAWV